MKKMSKIIFLLVAVATIFEFFYIQGMFTAPLVMVLVAVTALANIVREAREKQFLNAALYLVSSIALIMGYFPQF